jgi:presequence protease
LEQQIAEQEKAELEAVRSKLSEQEIENLIQETETLKARQQAEDPPEKLALIPSLTMDDLDREGRNIPISVGSEKGTTVLRHDLLTNGILYTDIGFDLRVIPFDLLPLVPLFSRCLTEMGTSKLDDVALSRYIQTHTGGLYTSTSTGQKHSPKGATIPEPQVVSNLFLRGKSTYAKTGELFGVMRDVLLETKLDNKAKFLQMALETKARMESSVQGSGHSYASGRIGSRYSVTELVQEQMGGIQYLYFIRQLVKDIESDWSSVLAKLEKIRSLLMDRRNMIINLSAEEKGMRAAQANLDEYIQSIPLRTEQAKIQNWGAELRKFEGTGEGFIVPTQVNYVGKGGLIYQVGEETSGSDAVVSRFLRTSWLWDKVRVVGGAYGAMNSFSAQSGVFKYVSYRDPNLKQTLDTYDATPEFLREVAGDMSASTLSNAIIGMIGDMDAPMSPDQKGFTSMDRYLTGLSDETRQRRREQV